MKKIFQNRLTAIDWIAAQVENEGQFEVMREQLNFNHIYSGEWYLEIDLKSASAEVVLLKEEGQA